MRKGPLSDSERFVLSVVLDRQGSAYGVSIRKEIKARSGRDVPLATIYHTLDRLEEAGLLRSKLGEATPERGGRPKMYFSVTAPGEKALQKSLEEARAMEPARLKPALGVL